MFDRIIQFSIRQKLIIGIATLALVIWGGYSVTRLPVDAVPDITNNQVQVLTVSPSLAAGDIERLVTFPVEQTMAGIPGIEEMRSFSRFGLSVVTIVFKEEVDIYWARQQVNERLNEAKTVIPPGAGTPELAPLSSGLGEIYQYVIHPKTGYGGNYTAAELRTIQDWIVRRQLLGTEGVADVSSFGGYLKQYEVALNPDRLRSMNVSVSEVMAALERNNQNTGGAYIDKKPNAYFIRSEGLVGEPEDIEKIVLKSNSNGTPVLIRDVATVGYGHATRYGAMTRNSEGEVVGGIVLMLKGANSSEVIKNVKLRIAQIEKRLPEGIVIEPFLDRTKLVNNAIGTVATNLAEGALIVICVLVLLLGNLRAGFIVASVIPLSMLFAISLMNLFGVSGNLMSLGAIDFGLIVDGAVIIVEATLHHLTGAGLFARFGGRRLSQSEMDGEVYASASKIRSSAAFGEIIILIVYLPILALVGVEGKMFKPMAQTVAFAILGAFVLSLTYVPMASALFLNKSTQYKVNISDKLMQRIQQLYAPVIRFALRRKKLVLAVSALLFAASLLVFSQMGGEFLPTLDEGDFAVETRLLQGSSISQTIETALKAAGILKERFPEVKEVIGKIGSSEIPTDPMPVEACDLIVTLKDKSEWTSAATRDELAEKMGAALADIPGVSFGFQQPIQMRFNELMTGARQDVVIKVYGEDLDALSDYAAQIGRLAAEVEGANDIYVEQVTGQMQIVVKVNRDRMAQFGVSVQDINQVIKTGFAGEQVGFVYEGEKRFDLVVRLDKDSRKELEDIKNLFVSTPAGQQVPVGQLADVEFRQSPSQIQRDDAKRRITVGFNVRGRDVESVVNAVKQKVESEIKFGTGYYATYGGTFKNLEEARARLMVAVPVALALIFLLLFFTFSSIRQSLLIFTAIPLSAIGGILALWFRGMPFSISAGVGFIALFGVAVLNGIVLVAEFNRLKAEGITDTGEIILKGTSVRLRPVVMTALVASLGFLPMALSHGAGAEVQKPLATVVIGGLVSATLLTLLVLPVLYWFSERLKATRKTTVAPFLLLSLLLCGQLAGQSQQALDLPTAIETAIKNNQTLKTAKLELEYTQALKGAGYDPGKTNVSLMLGQYNSVQRDNNFSISQGIPFPGLLAATRQLNQAQTTAGQLNLKLTQNEVVYQVKAVFNQLIYLRAQQQLLKSQDSLYTLFAAAVEKLYSSGAASLLEKTTAETQRLEARNQQAQNASTFTIYLTQLQALLNSNKTPEIAETHLVKLQSAAIGADSTVLAKNPGVLLARQQVEISRRQQRVDLAKAMPDITLGYFNQTLIGYQNIDGNDRYFGAAQRFSGFQVGLQLPLWFAPQTSKVKAAGIQKRVAENASEQYGVLLQNRYSQYLQEFKQHQATLAYYENGALPNALLIIKQAGKGFSSGEISFVEYLQHMRGALAIRMGYLSAVNDYNQSLLKLELIAGNN